jgi:hypothetical protein
MRTSILRLGAILAGMALLSACQLGTKSAQQYGYRGTGRIGDENGSVAAVRRVFETGEYKHVGELSMRDIESIDAAEFSLTHIQREHETFRSVEHLHKMADLNAL